MKAAIGHLMSFSDSECKKLFLKATIVLDANIILSLYRSSSSLRNQIFDSLNQVKERLWIPYQVAYEFAMNKITVSSNEIKLMKELGDSFRAHCKQLKDKGYLSDEDENEFSNFLQKWEQKCNEGSSSKDDEKIIKQLFSLFSGRVGERPNQEVMKQYEKQGEQRYKDKVPPGYLDKKKLSNPYGDYIIWQETMNYSKENRCAIIFITDDQKEDWWMPRIGGKLTSPRIELLDEFYSYTGNQRIKIYTLERFMSYQAKEMGQTLNEDVISELEQLSLMYNDEERRKKEMQLRSIMRRNRYLLHSDSAEKSNDSRSELLRKEYEMALYNDYLMREYGKNYKDVEQAKRREALEYYLRSNDDQINENITSTPIYEINQNKRER